MGSGFWVLASGVWGFGFLVHDVGPARRKEDQASRKYFLLPRSTSYLLEAALLVPRLHRRLSPPNFGLLGIKDTHRRRVLR